ncbi:unnamed protein product, partial [Amoebophrya sp. A25]
SNEQEERDRQLILAEVERQLSGSTRKTNGKHDKDKQTQKNGIILSSSTSRIRGSELKTPEERLSPHLKIEKKFHTSSAFVQELADTLARELCTSTAP